MFAFMEKTCCLFKVKTAGSGMPDAGGLDMLELVADAAHRDVLLRLYHVLVQVVRVAYGPL